MLTKYTPEQVARYKRLLAIYEQHRHNMVLDGRNAYQAPDRLLGKPTSLGKMQFPDTPPTGVDLMATMKIITFEFERTVDEERRRIVRVWAEGFWITDIRM